MVSEVHGIALTSTRCHLLTVVAGAPSTCTYIVHEVLPWGHMSPAHHSFPLYMSPSTFLARQHWVPASCLQKCQTFMCACAVQSRAWQLFDWVRALPEDHDLKRLCDSSAYTAMIALCGTWQQLRRALQLVADMRARSLECGQQVSLAWSAGRKIT